MPILALGIRLGPLVFAEREIAGLHLDTFAIHGLNEPAAGEGNDPLRLWIFVPVSYPAGGQDSHDCIGCRGFHQVLPGRRGRGAKALQLEIPQLAATLMTDAILVRPHMPIANGWGIILGYRPR